MAKKTKYVTKKQLKEKGIDLSVSPILAGLGALLECGSNIMAKMLCS